jgi:lysophospholipase L1-like esterase
MPWRGSSLLAAVLCAAPALSGCGGDTGTRPDPPAATYTVVVTVFYDENADGQLQADEVARVPGVEVQVGGRTATTEKRTGRATVAGVPEGTHRVEVRAATLPAFYQSAAPVPTVAAQQAAGTDVRIPLVLDIGGNNRATYMAYGDSITAGDGAEQHEDGYRGLLQTLLREHFGAGTVVDESQSGARSPAAAERIGASLNRQEPAYTLILYGTNDWQTGACRDQPPCDTVDNLRSMIGAARSVGSLPVLGTIPAVHPDTAQEGRSAWVQRMNEFVRPMARAEGAALADVEAAFRRSSDIRSLFADRIHPNDRGYEVIAAEFLAAISRPLGATSAAGSVRPLLRAPAGRP